MKRITVTVLFLLLVSAATATHLPQGPLQNVQTLDGIEGDITAGETDTVVLTFENHVRRPLPVYVAVTASSDLGIDGREFDVDAGLFSTNANTVNNATLTCDFAGHTAPTEGVYVCWSDGLDILPRATQPSQNTLHTSISSALHTAPGNYTFDVELYSKIGVPATKPKKRPLDRYTLERFEFNNTVVTLNTTRNTNATVEPYEDLALPGPANQTFLTAVGIDLRYEEYLGEGSDVRFSYSKNDQADAVTIYRYDDTTGTWTPLHTVVNKSKKAVEATIRREGVYAAYQKQTSSAPTEPEPPEEDEEDDASGYSPTTVTMKRSCTAADWSCTDWSSCENGIQTRTCEATTACAAENGYKPPVSRSCTEDTSEETSSPDTPAEEEAENVEDNVTAMDGEMQPHDAQEETLTGGIAGAQDRMLGVVAGLLVLVLVTYYREELRARL